jgi:hypothetical protein
MRSCFVAGLGLSGSHHPLGSGRPASNLKSVLGKARLGIGFVAAYRDFTLAQKAPLRVAVTTLVALFVSLTACSPSATQIRSSTPSKDRYVKKANAICAEANFEIHSLGQPSGSIRQQASHARRVNDITRDAIDRVRALPAPGKDAQMLYSPYDQASRALNLADRSTYAIEAGDTATANRQAARAAQKLTLVNQALEEYGLTECAK